MRQQVDALILFEVHAVIREEHDLGLRAALGAQAAQYAVERDERDVQRLGAADVQKPVGRLEEAEEVARLRGLEEALAEAPHVRAPDLLGRDVN